MSEGWRSVPLVDGWLRADDTNELCELIGDAVDRTISRIPVPGPTVGYVCCVSGGLDSSTVAAFAPDAACVTGWYDAPGCDEREWAAVAVDDRPWLEVKIDEQDFINAVLDLKQNETLKGLRCGPGAAGQWAVAKAVRQAWPQVSTLITGEGGDELFGGYARQMIALGYPRPEGYDDYVLPDHYPTSIRGVLDIEWKALRTLTAVDESVAELFDLRVETPLLDPWVVAWVFQQPPDLRIGKQILREAMLGTLPAPILAREDKRGFPVPFVAWAQDDPVRGFVEDLIGYVPDPAQPYDRQWWYDLLDA